MQQPQVPSDSTVQVVMLKTEVGVMFKWFMCAVG